jgi:hypothetical protein
MHNDEERLLALISFWVIGQFYLLIARRVSASSALKRWTTRKDLRRQPVSQSMAFCPGNPQATMQSGKESVTSLD